MKLFGTVITVIVFGFIGFFVIIILSLIRDAEFYVIFVPIFTIGLIINSILAIYGKIRKKLIKNSIILFYCLMLVTLIAFEGYQSYEKSLEVVSTQDVDLSEYIPFTENTKTVSLEESTTYQINDQLPILD
ncbi:hypothetical protein [Bacillus sp. PS06]|uniref:hypothetical protein n=1 Tax=Bacillus sp. PS06 TaxID=2764176 RepID=UPI00177C4CBA|nr:hypothetical protein [Bacillus sp. PS06]MBD8067800.1 hypothetical protein [Bacillus sp. PS06]